MTKVTKAVFPVAGLGTRFLPATKAQPKEMLPVVDKPLIQYAVEEAYAAGVREMIFDGAFVAARHENHLAHPGGVSFFDRVLDQWLVDYRQHLLGLSFGGRQEARAQTSHRKNRFVNQHFFVTPVVSSNFPVNSHTTFRCRRSDNRP